ncbi:CoA-binding protein [Streptococcus hongkongensis]|nr:CoA-binding protein [Streptococcus uberis]
MTYQFSNPSEDVIADYLKMTHKIAVIGLSSKPEAASFGVAKFMQAMGYEIIPVNPTMVGQTILGKKVYASLRDIPFSVDMVDVFRPSHALAEVAKDFVQTDAKIFWAQLGLESQDAEAILRSAGRQNIVMNKCLKIEYRSLMHQLD